MDGESRQRGLGGQSHSNGGFLFVAAHHTQTGYNRELNEDAVVVAAPVFAVADGVGRRSAVVIGITEGSMPDLRRDNDTAPRENSSSGNTTGNPNPTTGTSTDRPIVRLGDIPEPKAQEE